MSTPSHKTFLYNTTIASDSFVPQGGVNHEFPALLMQKGNLTHVIISNTMTLGKLVIKCSRKPKEDLWKYKSSRGLRGHLITNFPTVMVLVCNTMIDEEMISIVSNSFGNLMFTLAC